MQPSFDNLTFLLGDAAQLAALEAFHPRAPFDDETLTFLSEFSRKLLADPRARAYSDVVSLAFWCRPASLEKLRQEFMPQGITQGRGVAFHIAPSNVAVNFAFSLAAGLLTGNANIVRLSSKPFPQTALICDALKGALAHVPAMADSLCLVQYPHDAALTDYFSALCDARLIWGGDRTISEVRRSALRPRAVDIAFADRYSFAVIDADAWLAAPDKARLLEGFYNDTLLTSQQACTAAKMVVWTGERADEARAQFWPAFRDWCGERYAPLPTTAVSNLAWFCAQTVKDPTLRRIAQPDNRLFLAQTDTPNGALLADHHQSGLFIEYVAQDLLDIAPLCGEKCQTIVTFGVDPEEFQRFLATAKPRGVDRIVPIGQSMQFSLLWDGYPLAEMLTRRLTLISY
ncbi:acyl-CoA reductase [Cronobacter turicensis]